MTRTLEQLGLDGLSVTERLDLIGLIWDSITDVDASTPMPEWHRTELEQRIAHADAKPEAGVPWEEVKARLMKRG